MQEVLSCITEVWMLHSDIWHSGEVVFCPAFSLDMFWSSFPVNYTMRASQFYSSVLLDVKMAKQQQEDKRVEHKSGFVQATVWMNSILIMNISVYASPPTLFLNNTAMTKTSEVKDPVLKMKNLAVEGEDTTISSLRRFSNCQ